MGIFDDLRRDGGLEMAVVEITLKAGVLCDQKGSRVPLYWGPTQALRSDRENMHLAGYVIGYGRTQMFKDMKEMLFFSLTAAGLAHRFEILEEAVESYIVHRKTT